MPLTATAAANQIQERLQSIYQLVHDVESQRSRSEHSLNNIIEAYENVDPSHEILCFKQKLKNLYNAAITDGQQEEEVLRNALEKINEIRAIKNERRIEAKCTGNKETFRRGALLIMLLNMAQTLPLYVSKCPGARAPHLCGSISANHAYIAKSGDTVAAFVKDSEGAKNWILGEVVEFNHITQKYKVDDIDEEQKSRYSLFRSKVIPLPLMRANPETDQNALFSKGSVVLALYPQTTCFYKAIINKLPTTATEDYEVLFEDTTYSNGYSPPMNVPQRYVILFKEKRKQKKNILVKQNLY